MRYSRNGFKTHADAAPAAILGLGVSLVVSTTASCTRVRDWRGTVTQSDIPRIMPLQQYAGARGTQTPTAAAGLHGLADGWDGYGAPAPSPNALYWADRTLWAASSKGLSPSHVMACVDGGVTVHFAGKKSVTIEVFNSGEFVIATSSGPNTTQAQELIQSGESVATAVEQASVFLS